MYKRQVRVIAARLVKSENPATFVFNVVRSAKSLAAIANGMGEHLVHRVADVTLKERRPLVMVVRESPLNDIHLENMLKLSRMGVTILPPVPAFYNHPQDIDDIVNHNVGRVLDQFGIECQFAKRWDGSMA